MWGLIRFHSLHFVLMCTPLGMNQKPWSIYQRPSSLVVPELFLSPTSQDLIALLLRLSATDFAFEISSHIEGWSFKCWARISCFSFLLDLKYL